MGRKRIEKPTVQAPIVTEYDRIINMGVNEMTDFILAIITPDSCRLPIKQCYYKGCKECIKRYLERKVQK